MKILVIAIAASLTVAVIAGISLFVLPDNRTPCTFCPQQPSPPSPLSAKNNSSLQNVTTVIIPKDSEDQNSGKNYEPQLLVVVLGVNNTVRWINEALVGNIVAADSQDDLYFWNATHSSNGVLLQGKSFNFTFTKVGDFSYHGELHPWLRGWVLVLPQSTENLTRTVVLNDTKIPGPCEIFTLPCPLGIHSFTAQKFGSDIYMEKITINGVDHYAIIHPSYWCAYPQAIGTPCAEPDNVALLKIVQANMINPFTPLKLHGS